MRKAFYIRKGGLKLKKICFLWLMFSSVLSCLGLTFRESGRWGVDRSGEALWRELEFEGS
jgi:hypothetical protein